MAILRTLFLKDINGPHKQLFITLLIMTKQQFEITNKTNFELKYCPESVVFNSI